ncbi:MAG: endolytic transglycosylase MltG [Paracoccaceae bacterium]|nr:endolytic transglycosylase MltG [Paracoccaceae bacterium]
MWKHVASNALSLFVVVLVALVGLIAWGQRQYTQPGPLADPVCLLVERGSSMRAVSADLETDGAISNPTIFRIGADYEDRSGQLKFGSYLIPVGASMQEIVGIVTQGGRSTCGTEVNFRVGVATAEVVVRELDPQTNRYEEIVSFVPGEGEAPTEYGEVSERPDVRFRVTLAEGVTSWQVVEELKQADFVEGEVAEIPAEGSLAPDSYEVERGTELGALLTEMEERQAAILAELWQARDEDVPYESPEEALIMASIVEKETGVPEERPLVASVFVNRLEQGMKLQTDPTVIYGITEGRAPLGRGLRQSELRRETPYNTYVIDGLPPTPIANPGRLSIEAALHPERSDYLFFVADGSGGHVFAATLEEHNRNVARWREFEAEQQRQEQQGNP